MRRSDPEFVRCALCGAMAAIEVRQPWEIHRAARRAGFEFVLVKSGLDPIYQWQCAACRNMTRSTTVAEFV